MVNKCKINPIQEDVKEPFDILKNKIISLSQREERERIDTSVMSIGTNEAGARR